MHEQGEHICWLIRLPEAVPILDNGKCMLSVVTWHKNADFSVLRVSQYFAVAMTDVSTVAVS